MPAWRLTLVLCLAEALNMAGYSAVAALLPELRLAWSLGNAEIGIVEGAFNVGYRENLQIGAFPAARRKELFTELQPLVTTFDNHPWDWAKLQEATTRNPRSSQGSRWNAGKDLSFIPLRPELVVEVRYEHMEGDRFRHTAQFVRWRPDRDPHSCTYEQLEEPVKYDLADILSAGK